MITFSAKWINEGEDSEVCEICVEVPSPTGGKIVVSTILLIMPELEKLSEAIDRVQISHMENEMP